MLTKEDIDKLDKLKNTEIQSYCVSARDEFHDALTENALFGLIKKLEQVKTSYEEQISPFNRFFNQAIVTQLDTIIKKYSSKDIERTSQYKSR